MVERRDKQNRQSRSGGEERQTEQTRLEWWRGETSRTDKVGVVERRDKQNRQSRSGGEERQTDKVGVVERRDKQTKSEWWRGETNRQSRSGGGAYAAHLTFADRNDLRQLLPRQRSKIPMEIE